MKARDRGRIPDLVYSEKSLLSCASMIHWALVEQERAHREFWDKMKAVWAARSAGR